MRLEAGKILLGLGSAACTAALLLFALQLANTGKTAAGLRLAESPFGEISFAHAEHHIILEAHRFSQASISLFLDGKLIGVFPATRLGLSLDIPETTARVTKFGRSTSILTGLAEQLSAFSRHTNISPTMRLDSATLLEATQDIFEPLENPHVDADFSLDSITNTVSIIPAREGWLVDTEELAVNLALESQTLPNVLNIQLAKRKDIPRISTRDAALLRDDANALMGRQVFPALVQGKLSWPLSREELGAWLTIDQSSDARPVLSLRREAFEDFVVRNLVPALNREPSNAQFAMKDERVTAFQLSRDGQEVDIEETYQRFKKTLLEEPDAPQVEIAVRITPPDITTETIDTLGIRALLAVGESDFAGSPKNRIHNIKIGAARFNGVLIKPGEEFSFNTLLGEVGPEQGYLPELVIRQNKTVPEYGGGLCQVATTTFRSAVKSGLPILERYPHSYPVRYYGTPGFDATIYPPHPDLRFLNDTPEHILIQTKIAGTKLMFEFYGSDDGRNVEIQGPIVLERGADGSAKAKLIQKVLFQDGTSREKIFFSSYRSPSLFPVAKRNPLE